MITATLPLILAAIMPRPVGSFPDTTASRLSEILTATTRQTCDFTIKTNAIPWAATVMNIAGEIALSPKITLSFPVWYCPWFISEKNALRVFALQPECRWWINRTSEGHFFGPHISVAWFNMRHGDYRYQDCRRPLLGAGITYGYMLPIRNNWHIEFSIGAGYASLRYDRFRNTINGAKVDTRQTSYWGIDHAGISIAYSFKL